MKTLRRSITNRTIGGVCGGIADFFELDPVLIRVAFLLLAILGGCGVLFYILAWIVMPEQNPNDHIQETEVENKKKYNDEQLKQNIENVGKEFEKVAQKVHHSSGWFGYLLIFFGVAFLLRTLNYIQFSWCEVSRYWPILLIFLGISALPMKRWLKSIVLTLCLIGTLMALICNSGSKGCSQHRKFWNCEVYCND